MAQSLDSETQRELLEVFTLCDFSQKGSLTHSQFAQATRYLGLNLNKSEVQLLLSSQGNPIIISQSLYLQLMAGMLLQPIFKQPLREVFNHFQPDEKGRLHLREFKCAAKEAGLNEAEAEHLFSETDVRSRGFITFEQFQALSERTSERRARQGERGQKKDD